MGRVTFLHPDLGIGGAERLVVDAALALKGKGNVVNIVTTHHDRNHAFKETTNGELSVTVVGDWIPRSICNRFYALMSIIRMIYAAFYIILVSDFHPDVVFCDIVSVAVMVLRLRFKNVIFYCHYPDLLLSERGSMLKALYRVPIDALEKVSLGKATYIFVNSKFTADVFRKTFPDLNVNLDILYPSLNMNFFDSFSESILPSSLGDIVIDEKTICFLSINRYERKKNVALLLKAFNALRNKIDETDWNNSHVIIAGGFDSRVVENIQHLEELKEVCFDLNLNKKVSFLTSISDFEKISLIKMSTCLIYTPSNEHFGIVPIEAMYLCKPVIAVNSGGPTESIAHGKTGFLCEPTPDCFANAMKQFVLNRNLSKELGVAGRKRVSDMFSFEKFSDKLDETITKLMAKKNL